MFSFIFTTLHFASLVDVVLLRLHLSEMLNFKSLTSRRDVISITPDKRNEVSVIWGH